VLGLLRMALAWMPALCVRHNIPSLVVERDLDLDSIGDKVFKIAELVAVVLGLDALLVGSVHEGSKAPER